MSKRLTLWFSALLLLILAGCSPAVSLPTAAPVQADSLDASIDATPSPQPVVAAKTAIQAAPTLPPTVTPTQDPYAALFSACGLLNNTDLYDLLPNSEVSPSPIQVQQVGQPIFSLLSAPVRQAMCVFNASSSSGGKNSIAMQVRYWVEVAASARPARLSQAWADSQVQAAQPVFGLADGAIYKNSRLTFRQGDIYLTVEVTRTDQDASTSAGAAQQLAAEKALAQIMLQRLGDAGQ